jgi:hypothetical protein
MRVGPSEIQLTCEFLLLRFGFRYILTVNYLNASHIMPQQPCLCVPTCTRLLSRSQRMQHRRTLREAMALASDSSDDSGSEISVDNAEVNHLEEPSKTNYVDLNIYHRSNLSDLDLADSPLYSMDFDNPLDQLNETEHNRPERNVNQLREESDSVRSQMDEAQGEQEEQEQEDEITDNDLIHVLQEQFGDDWQAQLRTLRMFSISCVIWPN